MAYEYLLRELKKGSNYNYFSELGFLPNPDKLINRNGSTYDSLRELKSDPHLWSCIQSRKSGVLKLEYNISGSNKELQNEVNNIFKKIDIHQLIRDILEAPLFGFQPLEIIWNKDNQKRFIPERIIPLNQSDCIFNNKGEILIANGEKYISVNPQKILIAKYEASALNPYGESLLSKCFWSVKFKTGGLKLWITYMEKFGLPYITGKLNRMHFKEESDSLLDNLNDMSEGSVFVAPDDVDLQIIDTKKSDANELYRELIKVCNSEISKAILSQTLTTELDAGSYAAAQTHFKIRKELINADAILVERVINSLIKKYTDVNYNLNEYPQFRFIINDADDIGKIERDAKLYQTGVRFTKEYWKKTYGFADGDFELKED